MRSPGTSQKSPAAITHPRSRAASSVHQTPGHASVATTPVTSGQPKFPQRHHHSASPLVRPLSSALAKMPSLTPKVDEVTGQDFPLPAPNHFAPQLTQSSVLDDAVGTPIGLQIRDVESEIFHLGTASRFASIDDESTKQPMDRHSWPLHAPAPITGQDATVTGDSISDSSEQYPVVMASAELAITAADSVIADLFGPASPLKDDADLRTAALAKPNPQSSAKPKKKKKKKKAVVAAPKKGEKKKAKSSKSSKDEFKLAAQPKIGAHYVDDTPQTDGRVQLLDPQPLDFSGDALNPYLPYDPSTQINVYQGKTLNANQRPLVELGRPWYQLGQLSPGSSVLGFHNNVTPQFVIFGDTRVAYASNRQNGKSDSLVATAVNLDFDLKLTGTERFHAFISPTGGGQQTRYRFDDDRFFFEGDADIDFGFFEGDLGALVGGAVGKTLPFDLPFTVGIIPLVIQNGVWLEDAFLGVAATLPARNSPRFDISNMDITFFAGYDKLNSDAFPGDDSAARVIGIASFIETLNGYIEADYAFLDDRSFDDRSYHNIGISYTRRYGRFLSNSTRVIVNAGQSTDAVDNTADGVLLLSENSLITGQPTNIVPYFNMFAGFDRPQSVARAGAAGGILKNTGILFESDNLTGYPTLDATANDTFGFAAGINILSKEFSQQLVLETAMLGVMGDAATRNAQGDQYGVGFRYQLPLSNSVIFRADGMMGFLRNDDDVSGIRVEMRKKF